MLTILGLMAACAMPPTPLPAQAPATPVQMVAPVPDRADQLWEVLQLADLMPLLQQEAVSEAARMEADGLIAGGGLPWARVVERIHQPDRMEALFREGLGEAMARADPATIDRGLAFHASGLGRQVVGLEISARRALQEDGVEDQARAAFAQGFAADQPRAVAIARMIDDADMVAPNVAGGLNAAIAFSRGYAAAGGFDMPPDDRQMMSDAWAQRDQIEAEATAWLQGFLMLAYGPLEDAALSDYARHVASAEGQALSQLLFAGFDRVFAQTSYDMGVAAALRGQGQQL
ncbi:MAG: hypothetical protein ACK41Y_08970 [Paracoccus hibiscisoli]|uniref:hypothetical protein n=1 Tax=Paracoccus hibiscisoli TaxID=2023261 RepID=UPI00391C508D